MDNKLLIFKTGLNFWHRRNNNSLSDRNISDFEVSTDENFVIIELDGSQNWNYKFENVSVKVDSGAIENFTNRNTLIDRLIAISYTPYLNSIGLTQNQLLAIQNANTPTQSNPFATIDDITDVNKNEFKTLGTTTLTGSDLLISLGYSWQINLVLYANTTAENFPIPFTTTGKQRIDIFVATTNNNFVRIQGVESISSPVKPDVPQNTLELTFVLVGDAEIADPVLPNFGETFVEKIEKTELTVNTNNIFNVSTRVANFVLGNNVVQCSGINFTDNSVYYDGKKYSFKNSKTTDLILKNRTLVSGNVRFVFPNELDFILKPGEIAEFILRKRKFLFLEYVGVITVQEKLKIKNILANVTIDTSFDNSIALQKANATITLPSGLGATFNFVIRRFSATTTTFVAGAGATISIEGDGTSFTGKGMISVFCDGANNFIIAGQ